MIELRRAPATLAPDEHEHRRKKLDSRNVREVSLRQIPPRRRDETYEGQHGYSLRLVGLESGVNDLAYSRNIVIHGADYATAKFASRHGRLGRSWGCPALDPSVNRELIDAIRDRTALFAYYPDARWLASSPLLRCDSAPVPDAPVSIADRESLRSVPSALAPLAALTIIRAAD